MGDHSFGTSRQVKHAVKAKMNGDTVKEGGIAFSRVDVR
jgi:hypothetical protein